MTLVLKKYPKLLPKIGFIDSLCIGIAAVLFGAEKYYAFDIINHAYTIKNLKILADLVWFFQVHSAQIQAIKN